MNAWTSNLAGPRRRGFLVATLLLPALLASGCCWLHCEPGDAPRPTTMPAYGELAQRYHRHVAGLESLWARSVLEMEWYEKDSRRWAQGEGHCMMVLPDRTAVSAGKLGSDGLWAGSNRERFWFFDLQKGVVYFGRHDHVGWPGSRPLPAPVAPRDLPRLLGVVALDPAAAPPPAVDWAQGCFVLEPPGAGVRLFLDPGTALPRRVELLDAAGQAVVVAKLSNHQAVECPGKAPNAWPMLATRAEVSVVGRKGKLVLHLYDMSDGQPERIRDRVFDLEFLLKAHKPAQLVDLDGP